VTPAGSPGGLVRAPADGAPAAALLVVAAVALGTASQIGSLRYRPFAMLALTLALLATVLAVAMPRARDTWSAGRLERAARWLLGAGLFWQLALLAIYPPGGLGRPGTALFLAGLAVAAVVLAAELGGLRWLGPVRLPLLLTAHVVLGAATIIATPAPGIDVHTFHVEALRALGQGINPYAITMPDIYGPTPFYGAGVVADGRVQAGFIYPPLSLLFSGAGHVLAGDYRVANLAALAGAGALLATGRPGSLAAAALVLFTPRAFHVLGFGWTEPYLVLLLALTVWCASRARGWLPLALGLLFAAKQYTFLVAPLVLLLHPGPTRWRDTAHTLLVATGVAAAVTLPLAVADPAAFVHSVVGFHLRQPFRADALAYPAWWEAVTGGSRVTWLGWALLPPTIAFALRRAPATPAGFAAAVALTFLVFFAFGQQAFANYYVFVIGALGCALAATPPGVPAPAES
jgi:hypothetical protein